MDKQQALNMINGQFASYRRLCDKPEYQNDFVAQGSFYSVALSTADGMREAFYACGVFTSDEDDQLISQLHPRIAPFKCVSVSLD